MVISGNHSVYFNECDKALQPQRHLSAGSDEYSEVFGKESKNSSLLLISMCQAGMFSKKLKFQSKDTVFNLDGLENKYKQATNLTSPF